MKHYLLLPVAAAFMISPALAQSSDTSSGNLESQEDVIRGAEESERGPLGVDLGDELRTGRSAAEESGTNSENLETHDDVWRGAEQSSGPNIFDDAEDDFEDLAD